MMITMMISFFLQVKPEEFPMKFPDGVEVVSVPSGKEYLKKTSQPK